jgi:hypothetical protein
VRQRHADAQLSVVREERCSSCNSGEHALFRAKRELAAARSGTVEGRREVWDHA